MREAVLTAADLSVASLVGANLAGADMTSAIVASTNWHGAQYDESTIFPSGNTYEVSPSGLQGDAAPWQLGMIPAPEPSLELLLFAGVLGLRVLADRRPRTA